MLHFINKLPTAIYPLSDLQASFHAFSVPPEVSQKITLLSQQRAQFYDIINQIQNAPLEQFQPDFNWMPLYEYISGGYDLLEYSTKFSNFPLSLEYISLLNPSHRVTINNSNEVASTMEIIYSRYCYCLAALRSVSGHLGRFRQAKSVGNVDLANSTVKDMLERVKNGVVRVYKLWSAERFILVGFC